MCECEGEGGRGSVRDPEGGIGEGEGEWRLWGKVLGAAQGFRAEPDGAAERQGQPADSRPITRRHRQQIRRIAAGHRRGEGTESEGEGGERGEERGRLSPGGDGHVCQ